MKGVFTPARLIFLNVNPWGHSPLRIASRISSAAPGSFGGTAGGGATAVTLSFLEKSVPNQSVNDTLNPFWCIFALDTNLIASPGHSDRVMFLVNQLREFAQHFDIQAFLPTKDLHFIRLTETMCMAGNLALGEN